MKHDYLIVGAGLFGCVIAERLANVLNKKILVIDERNHIGGNCYSEIDSETGIEIHKYGTHVFHTNIEVVWDYINKFTSFNKYQHKVVSFYQGSEFPMPINLLTLMMYYKSCSKEAKELLEKEIEQDKIENPRNFEEEAVSIIGKSLYSAFILNYTRKQWGRNPKELPKEIVKRIPIKYNCDCNYFEDKWQGIPLNGYQDLFLNLLSSKNIEIKLNCDFFKNEFNAEKVIYTGSIDRYFDFAFGKLEYRSVSFDRKCFACENVQNIAVMNYADPEEYTRSHEFKHLHPERDKTNNSILFFEKSSWKGCPCYPIEDERNKKIYKQYEGMIKQGDKVMFGGRLGEYKYYNMDETIQSALRKFQEIEGEERCR